MFALFNEDFSRLEANQVVLISPGNGKWHFRQMKDVFLSDRNHNQPPSPEGPLHVSAAVNPSFFYVKHMNLNLVLLLDTLQKPDTKIHGPPSPLLRNTLPFTPSPHTHTHFRIHPANHEATTTSSLHSSYPFSNYPNPPRQRLNTQRGVIRPPSRRLLLMNQPWNRGGVGLPPPPDVFHLLWGTSLSLALPGDDPEGRFQLLLLDRRPRQSSVPVSTGSASTASAPSALFPACLRTWDSLFTFAEDFFFTFVSEKR